MTLLHDAYTALLAGLTHRTGKEIHWHNIHNQPITIEPIDVDTETYIVREYYHNGNLKCEDKYINNQREGLVSVYYDTGELYFTWEFKNNKLVGNVKMYEKDGEQIPECEFDDGP
jgi:antitoxin component YwqK of YwqJK toxin-antitoxin module